jgi:hypothetical protein
VIGDDVRQPVSGPMSREVADWYVGYTDGQVEAFERGGQWYLCVPESWEACGAPGGAGGGSVRRPWA